MPRNCDIRILASKRQRNTAALGISTLLPGADLADDGVVVRQTLIQALPIQDANLNFSHIQPASVFRSVAKDDATQKSFLRLGAEHLIEGFTEVGVEITHDQMFEVRCGVGLLEPMANESDEVGFGAAVGDKNCSSSTFGLYRNKQIFEVHVHVAISKSVTDKEIAEVLLPAAVSLTFRWRRTGYRARSSSPSRSVVDISRRCSRSLRDRAGYCIQRGGAPLLLLRLFGRSASLGKLRCH